MTVLDEAAEALRRRLEASLLIDKSEPLNAGVVGQPFAATERDLAETVLRVAADRLRAEADRRAANACCGGTGDCGIDDCGEEHAEVVTLRGAAGLLTEGTEDHG